MKRERDQPDLLAWVPPVSALPSATIHDLLPEILMAAWRKRGTKPAVHDARILEMRPRTDPQMPKRRTA